MSVDHEFQSTNPATYEQIDLALKLLLRTGLQIIGRFKVARAIILSCFLTSLTVSPVLAQRLSYSTYLGGPNGQESINNIKVDSSGNAYVTFYDYNDTGPSHDFVISKISPNGATGYTTVLGNFHSEEGAAAVAVDGSGNAYITGWAYSYPQGHPRFPSVDALQPEPSGGVDAVVVKLDPQGKVVFSTYLGGSGDDYGRDIALDASGNIYVTGTTSSPDFPTRSAFQAQRVPGGKSGNDVFLTEIDAAGSRILYSTYLGGNDDDSVTSVAIDSSGNIYLAGSTRSLSFAGHNLQRSAAGCKDSIGKGPGTASPCWNGYAVKFNQAGTSLIYSHLWSDEHQDHVITAAALDRSGNLWVAEQRAVRKLSAAGDAFAYSKNTSAVISGIAVDSQGNAYLTGCTSSFPSSQNRSLTTSGCHDLYVSKVAPETGAFLYETSLNGTMREPGDHAATFGASSGSAITVTASGAVYVGGYSESYNFPTTNRSVRSSSTATSTQDAVFFVLEPDGPVRKSEGRHQ